jgi:VIT1/CCC1 family predicted Fe2+/Mn2+ transporter
VQATPAAERQTWFEPVLSPQQRLSEVLFGLIMVLSITGSLSVAGVGADGVREMLIAAIGCNTAWGIVDAVMYLIDNLVERYRAHALLDGLRREPDPGRGQEMIAARLPEVLAESVRAPELEHVRQQLLTTTKLPPAGLTGRDLLGALAVFLLVFLSTFPVVLPFLFPLEPRVALRASNSVAILLLFLVGLRVGKYVSYRPLLVACGTVAIGAVLVVITIALGG